MKNVKQERYVVEASFNDQSQADAMKRLVRKHVSFSGGGCGHWMADLGWSYKTKRGAFAAASRLQGAGHQHVRIYPMIWSSP
jgi:hypothetical protein